jgi:2-oxoisovalerate dehydrogenase E2 component (dihydrolipoyl transacylase)
MSSSATAGAQARRRRVRPAVGGRFRAARGLHGGAELRGADRAQEAGAARGGRPAGGAGPHMDTGADPRTGADRGADSGAGVRTRTRTGTGTGGTASGGAQADSVGPAAEAGTAVRAGWPVPVISPLVRKLARDHGLDLRELAGSGPEGLIMRADVEHAVRAAASADAAPVTSLSQPADGGGAWRPTGVGGTWQPADTGSTWPAGADAWPRAGADSGPSAEAGPGLRIPLRGMRGAIADKMTRSRREIPDATCWVDADATELLGARAAMNAAGGPKISVLALLARICTAALARHPELNATVDAGAREIVRLERVHLGFAAQTERGLLVPVVRDAQSRDAQSLSTEFARLTEAARSGALTPGELTGGTFTLNNYGVFGVDGSTPIVNHPEAAMLGVGRISAKPWVHQGVLAVRQVVQLSLTFDHRVCDGGTAGGFLRYVADCVEQPVVLLRSV